MTAVESSLASEIATQAGRQSRLVGYNHAIRKATASSPWNPSDLFRLLRLAGVGLAGLGICWFEASGKVQWHDQIAWLAGSICALSVAVIGMVMWLLVGLREVHREALDIITDVRAGRRATTLDAPASVAGASSTTTTTSGTAGDKYVVGSAMSRVHRPSCSLVRGKVVEQITESEIGTRQLGLCGVCCE